MGNPQTVVFKVKSWRVKDSCAVYVQIASIQAYTYSMELEGSNILQIKSIHACLLL
jgi:hypothetical protein